LSSHFPLPIDQILPKLSQALATQQQIILSAPPGAGKSTRLPLYLCQNNLIDGQIILLEPRRLAARNIASYLASELGEKPGQTVGLIMRGENKSCADTKLLVVTEGVLTRMLQSDPELSSVGLIIFDEFHERSIHADLGLALALEVQQVYNERLKLLIMSATLDNLALSQLLPEAAYLSCEGRSFPVQIYYLPAKLNQYLDVAMTDLIKSAVSKEQGSVLVFLPGQKEIERVNQALQQWLVDTKQMQNVSIFPLYGRLDFAMQQKAIAPCSQGQRKIVLATNVAETSLTIEGVRVVVDSGLERRASFHIKSGITELATFNISLASAEQRRGRAGRIEPGVCYRLWSESRSLDGHAPAQIMVSDLTSLCLELAAWGGTNVDIYQWLDKPPSLAAEHALQSLKQLQAIDDSGLITAHGKKLHQLGTDIRIAQLIYTALEWQQADKANQGLVALAVDLAALIQEGLPRECGRDLLSALPYVRNSKKLKQAADTWLHKLKAKRQVYNTELAGALLAQAYPDTIGMARNEGNGRFLLSGVAVSDISDESKLGTKQGSGVGAWLHESEPLARADFIVAPVLMRNKSAANQLNRDVQILAAIRISLDELREYCPHLISQQASLNFDSNKKRVVSESREQLGALLLSRRSLKKPEPELLSRVLLQGIRQQGAAWLLADEKLQALLCRLQCGALWLPDETWFDAQDQSLMAELELWLVPYLSGLSSLAEVKKLNLKEILLNRLDWQLQQKLATLLPEVYHTPAGGQAKIRYQVDQAPICSVRMQQLYGLAESPKVANGKVNLLLELLSPAQRPIQLTPDLKQFWQGSYQEVKKEMKGRYPKHFWPDSPATAKPTLWVKNRSDISES